MLKQSAANEPKTLPIKPPSNEISSPTANQKELKQMNVIKPPESPENRPSKINVTTSPSLETPK